MLAVVCFGPRSAALERSPPLPRATACSARASSCRPTRPSAGAGASAAAGRDAALLALGASPRRAAAAQDDKDFKRVVEGCRDIDRLLNDFENLTTKKCTEAEKSQGTSGSGCPRDPGPIQEVLGLRSTTHPLFQIEKLFKVALTSGKVEDIDAWEGAIEGWTTHSSDAREFAYTASFGEYNPGGGKDTILKYIELSRESLKLARKDLGSVAEQLGLSV